MNTIEVTVTGAAGVSVDEVRDRVPELVEELRERLTRAVKALDPAFEAVIQLDRAYTGS